MKHHYIQSTVTVLALASLVLLTDPFMNLMPTPTQMLVLMMVAVLLSISVAFIFSEQASDERDVLHRMEAGRIGYGAGLSVLIIALLVQGFSHHIDAWIIIVITIMLAAKVAVRLYDTIQK